MLLLICGIILLCSINVIFKLVSLDDAAAAATVLVCTVLCCTTAVDVTQKAWDGGL